MSIEVIAMIQKTNDKVDRLEIMMEQMIKMAASTIENQGEFGKRLGELNDKIDSVNSSLTDKIDFVNSNLTNKIDSVNSSLTNKIDSVNSSLTDKINAILNEQINMNFKIDIISQEQILTNYKFNAFQHTLASIDKKD